MDVHAVGRDVRHAQFLQQHVLALLNGDRMSNAEGKLKPLQPDMSRLDQLDQRFFLHRQNHGINRAVRRIKIEHAVFPVHIPFARRVKFFEQVEDIITAFGRAPFGRVADAVRVDAGRSDPALGGVDRPDLERFMGPVVTPETVHPDPFVDPPARWRVARVFKGASFVAVLPFAGRFVDRLDTAINDLDDLRPAGVRPARQSHRLAVAEDFHLAPSAEFVRQGLQGFHPHTCEVKHHDMFACGLGQAGARLGVRHLAESRRRQRMAARDHSPAHAGPDHHRRVRPGTAILRFQHQVLGRQRKIAGHLDDHAPLWKSIRLFQGAHGVARPRQRCKRLRFRSVMKIITALRIHVQQLLRLTSHRCEHRQRTDRHHSHHPLIHAPPFATVPGSSLTDTGIVSTKGRR